MAGKISRRDFLKKSAVGVVAGTVILSTLDLQKLVASSKSASFKRSGDDVIVKLSDAKNSALATVGGSVLLDDDNILIRTSQTQFLAVNLICKHKGCTVELQGDKFVCPCHGSEYALDGKVTQGPSKANLRTFEAIFDSEKGTVTVKMEKTDKPIKDTTKVK
jgi:cytochrome b6-f complex iron-sulfur subunit